MARITAPDLWVSSHKTGTLPASLTVAQIQNALGSIRPSSGGKSSYNWEFLVDGVECAIWDYKDARWSTYGPKEAFDKLGLPMSPYTI